MLLNKRNTYTTGTWGLATAWWVSCVPMPLSVLPDSCVMACCVFVSSRPFVCVRELRDSLGYAAQRF